MQAQGRRAFVVEDEYFVLLDIKDALTRIGCVVVHAAASLSEAVDWARRIDADFAVIDVNIKGEKIYPAAAVLKERDIPFIFCSGYDHEHIDPQWSDSPSIQKPFSVDELSGALERWLDSLP